jgi:hypothetical protein
MNLQVLFRLPIAVACFKHRPPRTDRSGIHTPSIATGSLVVVLIGNTLWMQRIVGGLASALLGLK